MSIPNIQIYQIEDWLELSISTRLSEGGVNDPAKQQDTAGLKTPRVEVKAVWNGFNTEHYWVNQNTGEKWPDVGEGKLYLKVVTARNDKNQNHSRVRGMCRWLMSDVKLAGAGLQFHRIEKMLETASVPDHRQDEFNDISLLSFYFKLSILPSAFPQT